MINTKHLKKGDSFPILPIDDGKLILLSMRFCPYAQRTHLVLDAKQIPYHTVNINLKEKPEWLTKYSKLGKVPAVGLTNESCQSYIYESLIVADYLDDKFSNNKKLYPNDLLARAQDRIWIERFNSVITPYYRAVLETDYTILPKHLNELNDGLDKFEDELKKRNTKFFFSDLEPGMLDYMIWPWYERFPVLKYLSNNPYEMDKERYPNLLNWINNMKEDSAVQNTFLSGEIHNEFLKHHKTGKPEYDFLVGVDK